MVSPIEKWTGAPKSHISWPEHASRIAASLHLFLMHRAFAKKYLIDFWRFACCPVVRVLVRGDTKLREQDTA